MNARRPTLIVLFLTVFIDLIGFGIIMPLLPYYAEKLGVSGFVLGWLFASFSLMQFLFSPWWGRLSDRIGRRPLILLGLAGSTLSYLLFAYADSLALVLASRLLAGFCGANISVANAYVADITTKENRSKGMGLIGAAFGLGFIFGPVLAALLAAWSYRAPALAAAGLSGAAFLLACLRLPESLSQENRMTPRPPQKGGDWQYVLRKPVLGLVILIGFLFNLAITQWETTFALFLFRQEKFGYTLQTFGWLLAFVGFIVALMQGGAIGRLTKRFGEIRLLRTGLLLFVAGLVALAFCDSLGQLLACLGIFGLSMGLTRPVMTGTVSIFAEAHEQGLVLGVFQSAASLARILGPLMGGWLLDQHLRLPLLVAAGLGLLGFLLATRLDGSIRKTAPEPGRI